MGSIALRRLTRRHRRRAAGLLVAFALAGVVVLHHSGVATGDMHHGGMDSAMVEMCLGVFTAVGAAVVAVALGVFALGRWRIPPCGRGGRVHVARRSPEARARAGPPALHLLCVLRL
ncbi:MAG: hypothetical protein ACR2NB_11315 [Solirubrobacteraceae bacterium]